MGGVGKTALAQKLAEDMGSLYPDAQLYLDLQGANPHPLTAAQALAHLVRSFHPEARLPEEPAELAALYRSVLHGKHAILLMDNARDKAQLEPLIPPAGSLLLVTSRFHFTLPGLVVRNLDELPEEDACALLLRIAPRIAAAASEIARLCGRLPLALRLAGSALAERRELTAADYTRRLKEGKERLDPVEASLGLGYELLSEHQQRLWRPLAVFPGTFDALAAAALWELETDPAIDALGDLLRNSLVERDDNDGRFRLHDLARSFADRRLEDAEREIGRRRHALYYLEVLETANRLYERDTVLPGLSLLDSEWGNVQAGQTWAANHFSEDDEAARICAAYPYVAAFLLDLRQPPKDRIRWREPALAAARQLEDRRIEGVHLTHLGLAFSDLGDVDRAVDLFEQGLAISRETGNRAAEGLTLGYLGIASTQLGQHQRAIDLYEQQLTISREIGDRRSESKALGNLGLAYASLGKYRHAVELYEQDLAIARETGDRRGEGQTLGNLGNAYSNLGDPRRAIETFERELAIVRELGDRRGEASASWNLGLIFERKGDLARAEALMQVFVDYEREIGHPDAEQRAVYLAGVRTRGASRFSLRNLLSNWSRRG